MARNAYFEQFEDQVTNHPDHIALKEESCQFSYQELNRWSNSIAHRLMAEQITTHVGILIGSEAAYVAALLACGKAGKSFVPLDIKLPSERLDYLVTKAQINTVLCLEQTLGLLDQVQGVDCCCVDVTDNLLSDSSNDQSPALPVKGADPCYVMFTSGSTGQPKAVVGQHKGLAHFLNWERETFNIQPSDTFSWLAPVTFDVSLRDILTPLISGGTLAIPSEETLRHIHRLLSWLEQESVTHMHCVPSVFRLLTEALAQHAKPAGFLSRFKRILLAGEPTWYSDVEAWRQAGGAGIELVNLYGPTETTLAKLYHVIGADESGEGMVPIGQPLPQTHVLIINGGQLCAPGEIGEIYIRTPYRSLGYLDDTSATQNVFIQNPLHNEQTDILYKTGDLGRYLDNEQIICLGRLDNQVKINGVRIELGEVEAACRKIETLRQVAVVAIEKERSKSLCCYYNCQPELAEPVKPNEIRQALSVRLGEALIPQYYVHLNKFPTLINGKVNRKALPEPEDILYSNQEIVEPCNAIEEQLCDIWSDILGISRVCVEASFFDLGGDSFKMMRVLSSIYKAFGKEISLKQWLEDSRISQVAKLLTQSESAEMPEIPLAEQQDFYPVTAAQARLWTLYKMQQGHSAYSLPEEYWVSGELDLEVLQLACQHLIARHESLRTLFFECDGVVYQRITPSAPFSLESNSWEHITEAHQSELIAQNQSYSFDLEAGPLLKLSLHRCYQSERSLLLFNIHHIISDGWSLTTFVKELALLYTKLSQGEAPLLQPLSLQFKDYVVWQQQQMLSAVWQDSRRWWLQHLAAPLPVLELPRDYPRPVMKSYNGRTCRQLLPAPLFDSVKALAREQGVSLYTLLSFVVRTLLYRCTGQKEIIIGTPVAGRIHPALNEQVGYFVNTLAIRQSLETDVSGIAALQQTAQIINDALSHQHYPFESLIDELELPRDISRSPLFDVIVVLQNFELVAPQLGDAQMDPVEKESQWDISRCDLVFHFQEDEQGLLLDINYNSDIFSAERMQRYGTYFTTLIDSLVSLPTQIAQQIELLPAGERNQVLSWGKGEITPRQPLSIPELLAQICRSCPEAVAVEGADEVLTYQQLLDQASTLAKGLSSLSLEPGSTVALAFNRDTATIKALLAIIMAGYVYMPLDTGLPDPRIQQQLTGSRCKAIVLSEELQGETLQTELACYSLPQLTDKGELFTEGLPEIGADSPAYIIYTSGSTGTPKGALLRHQGFVNMSLSQIAQFEITSESRVLQFASLSFDASLANIFMALFSGARLVLVDQQTIEQPQRFLHFIAQKQISVVTLPPAYLKALNQPPLPGVRTLITAGEAANAEDVRYYCQQLNYFNAYGPTETSVCATLEAVSKQSIDAEGYVSIGKPIANSELFILIDGGALAPVGVVGELYISGEGLAQEYIGDSAATQAAFIPLPDGLAPFTQQKRLYKTGDLACWDEQGRLMFVGRNDRQVKINAFRIDSSEVENQLLEHPEISAAYVDSHRANESNKLAAWVIPERQPELWPSVAEFYVYDDMLYGAMARDEARNNAYLAAFSRHLKDKVVLEVGPGSEVILSQLAIQAGAKKVYAVELLEETWKKASARVNELGLEDKIILIHADIQQAELPELADWCISEIVGGIGGSEGSAKLINSCRHLLKEPANMLPMRSLTAMAAVSLDHEELFQGLSPIAAHYVEQIFTTTGHPFDLRLCIKNLPKSAVISDHGVLEDLDYTQHLPLESVHRTCMTINTKTQLSGVVCWLQLFVDEQNSLDSLFAEKSWLPVYVPLFDGQTQAVSPGDRLELEVERRLCANQLNPDFIIRGKLCQQNGEELPIYCESLHQSEEFRGGEFYRQLFSENEQIRVKDGVTVEKLREYLAGRLPNYAVPHLIQFMEHFPLTVNGKIDRSGLPVPAHRGGEIQLPVTELEQTILLAWKKVLNIPEIGINDNFFALGGDSINAIQLVAALSEASISVETRDIFLNPTIAQLALVATESKSTAEQGRVQGQYPLSPIQRWAFSTFGDRTFWFNQACMLHAEQHLDRARVEQALTLLVEQHDMLRAQIHSQDGERIQWLADKAELELHYVKYRGADSVNEIPEQEFTRWHSSFGPEAPLFRTVVLQLEQHDILLLVVNHLITDAVSWRIITHDLKMLLTEPGYQLPLKSEAFVHWAEHLAQLSEEQESALERGYWEQLVDDCQTLEAAFGKDGVSVGVEARTMASSQHVTFCIESGLIENLTGLVRSTNFELEHIYLTALGHSLQALTGRANHLMTLESHGRTSLPFDKRKMNLSRTVGWFTCFYPSLLAVQPDEKETLNWLDASHSDLAEPALLYMLLRWLHEQGEKYQLNPQIGFNYLGDFSESLASNGTLQLDFNVPGVAHDPELPREHAIDWLMMREEKGLMITVSYHQDEYSDEEILQLVDGFRASLQKLEHYLTGYSVERSETAGFSGVDITNDELDSIFE